MPRPQIAGLDILMSFDLIETSGKRKAALLEGGYIVIPRDEQAELIDLHQHIDHVIVDSHGTLVHPGPTGCLGGLVAGLINAVMSKKGVAQGKFRVLLRDGGERRFQLDPDDLRGLMKALKEAGIRVASA